MRFSKPPCCGFFLKMFDEETDNEGYGSLAYGVTAWEIEHCKDCALLPEDVGRIFIGSELPWISFCPYCGSDLGEQRAFRED